MRRVSWARPCASLGQVSCVGVGSNWGPEFPDCPAEMFRGSANSKVKFRENIKVSLKVIKDSKNNQIDWILILTIGYLSTLICISM